MTSLAARNLRRGSDTPPTSRDTPPVELDTPRTEKNPEQTLAAIPWRAYN